VKLSYFLSEVQGIKCPPFETSGLLYTILNQVKSCVCVCVCACVFVIFTINEHKN